MSSAEVAKVSADGVLDASFGMGGFFRGGFGSAVTFASDLDVDAQGRPLVAGTREGGPTAAAVLRVTTAGALDATFGTNGVVTTNFGAEQARIRGVDLDVDAAGRVLLAAEIFTPSAAMNGGSWGLARFDAAGNVDAAGFCALGRSGFAGSASVSMGLTSAGKPVVATTNQLVSGGTAPGPVVFRFQGGDGAAACDTPIDGAERPDAGAPADASVATDAGPNADAGATADAGASADVGVAADGGGSADVGASADAAPTPADGSQSGASAKSSGGGCAVGARPAGNAVVTVALGLLLALVRRRRR